MGKTEGVPYKGTIKKRLKLLQRLYKFHHEKETFSMSELLKEFKVSHRFVEALLQHGHIVKIERGSYYSAVIDNPTRSFTESLWKAENKIYRGYMQKSKDTKLKGTNATGEEIKKEIEESNKKEKEEDTPPVIEEFKAKELPTKFSLDVDISKGTVTLPINILLAIANI